MQDKNRPKEENPVVEILRSELSSRKAKNPRYSIRAFAQQLGIESSSLSKFLSGQRNLTFRAASDLLDALDVPIEKKNALLLWFDDPANFHKPAERERRTLTPDELKVILEWQHYAILSALKIQTLRTEAHISHFLGLDHNLVAESTERLCALQLIERSPTGELHLTGHALTTSRSPLDLSQRLRANISYIERAIAAAEAAESAKSGEHIDFSGMTVASSPALIAEAARRIREFRRALAEFLESGEKTTVLRMNIQLFDLHALSPSTKAHESS